jgi:hypothetical protein
VLMLDGFLAYIDPGSGSLFIQVLIATVLATPYFLRTQIAKASRAVRRRKEPEPSAPDSSSSGDVAS